MMFGMMQKLRASFHVPPPSAIDFLLLAMAGLALLFQDIYQMGFAIFVAVQRLTIMLGKEKQTVVNNHLHILGSQEDDQAA